MEIFVADPRAAFRVAGSAGDEPLLPAVEGSSARGPPGFAVTARYPPSSVCPGFAARTRSSGSWRGDCTRLVLKIKNLNVDYWNAGQSLGWLICMQAMARRGYLPPQGHGGAFTQDEHFIGQAGRAAADIYGIATGIQIAKNRGEPYPGGKAPLVDRFVAEMQKYSPSSADVESLETLWTQTFWTASRLFDEAIRRQTDAITWAGVNKWIQSQREWSFGLFPPMSFDPKCKISPTPWIFQWKWGRQRLRPK